MAIAAHDPEDRVEQLISLTKRLSDLMVTETKALKAREIDASSRDWEEKERLAHTYRMEMSDLSKNSEQLVSLPADLRKVLFETTRRFQEILADHGKALAAMQKISEGLVEAIAREVASEANGPRGYGASGQQDGMRASGLAVNAKA